MICYITVVVPLQVDARYVYEYIALITKYTYGRSTRS